VSDAAVESPVKRNTGRENNIVSELARGRGACGSKKQFEHLQLGYILSHREMCHLIVPPHLNWRGY